MKYGPLDRHIDNMPESADCERSTSMVYPHCIILKYIFAVYFRIVSKRRRCTVMKRDDPPFASFAEYPDNLHSEINILQPEADHFARPHTGSIQTFQYCEFPFVHFMILLQAT